jgi:diaminopimelate decarboxylase
VTQAPALSRLDESDGAVYRSGQLQLGSVTVAELLDRAGTPSVLMLPRRAAANTSWYQQQIAHGLPGVAVQVYYALKASYDPDLCRAVVDAGAGLEIMSHRELRLAADLGIGGDLLVVNGLGRSGEFTREAIAARPALLVCDTEVDLDQVSALAAAARTPVRVGLRLGLGERRGRLGLHWPGEFLAFLDRVRADPWLEPTGLLVHSLHHEEQVAGSARQAAGLGDALLDLQGRGVRFEVLDVGGGLAGRRSVEQHATLARHAAAYAGVLARLDHRPRLFCEPGRALVADAAVGLARVTATKRVGDLTWLVLDVGTNYLVPVPGATFTPLPLRSPAPGEETVRCAVSDQSCTGSVLCPEVWLPRDVTHVAVLDAGAYTGVFAHAWGPPMPAVHVLRDGQLLTRFPVA